MSAETWASISASVGMGLSMRAWFMIAWKHNGWLSNFKRRMP
jgi:hypothetical protein